MSTGLLILKQPWPIPSASAGVGDRMPVVAPRFAHERMNRNHQIDADAVMSLPIEATGSAD
jgi:hypothetical protein